MSEIGRISGLAEVMQMFGELPTKVEKNIARSALRKSAKKIVEEAKKRAPVKTGTLKANIKIVGATKGRQRTRAKNGILFLNVKASVLVNYKQAGTKAPRHVDYAGRVEYGTSTTTAKPFMRPAYDACKDEILSNFVKELEQNIQKAVK